MDEPRDHDNGQHPGEFGPLPASPEHDSTTAGTPAPEETKVARSPSAPDWWEPGLSVPPPGAAPKGFHIERGRAVSLRPMGVGETLDATIKLYRGAWRPFLGVSAVVLIPLSFLQAFVTRGMNSLSFGRQPTTLDPSTFGTTAVWSAVFVAINFLLAFPFLTALFARMTSEIYLGGEPKMQDALRFASRRIGAILLVTILAGLATGGTFLLLIIPGIILYIRFAFGATIVVIEDQRGLNALRRSWHLTRGHFWRLLGTLVLAGLISSMVSGIIGVPLTLVGQALGPGGWPLVATGSAAAGIIARPFSTIVCVVLYFDLRIRKEGFDIGLMVDEFARTPREA